MDVSQLQQPDIALLEHIKKHIEVSVKALTGRTEDSRDCIATHSQKQLSLQ